MPGKKTDQTQNIFSGNILRDITDHYGNYVILYNTGTNPAVSKRPNIRLFTDKNKQNFIQELCMINWDNEVMSCNDPNTAYNSFFCKLLKTYDKNFPLTRMSRRGLRDKKWITKGIKIASKRKNSLYLKWLKSRNPIDHLNYKKYKNIFTKISKAAETNYYKRVFNDISNNTKKIWAQINSICSFKKKQKSNISITKLKIDNNEIIEPVEISSELNKYFCSVGVNLSDKLPTSQFDYSHYMDHSLKESFFCNPISETEVILELQKLAKKRKASLESINPEILSQVAFVIAKPLRHIYNCSRLNGRVPDEFKTAKIIPIYKKGDTASPGNYRPISLLPVFNKIFEKLICNRLLAFLINM